MGSPSDFAVVTAEGIGLVGDARGSGSTSVLLVHGGGQTRHAWRRVPERLVEAGFQVARFDLRGHGDSGWAADGDYHLPALAKDVALVARTVSEAPVLVGASIGGLAAFLAIADGFSAKALVLVDASLRPADAGTARTRAFMGAHPQGFATVDAAVQAVAAFRADGPPPRRASVERSLRRTADGRWRWHWDPRFLDQADSIAERGRMLESVANRVTVPVVLIRGAASDVVDDAAVEAMRRLVPHLTVVEVAGASHTMAGGDNDAFERAIVGSLVELGRAAPGRDPM